MGASPLAIESFFPPPEGDIEPEIYDHFRDEIANRQVFEKTRSSVNSIDLITRKTVRERLRVLRRTFYVIFVGMACMLVFGILGVCGLDQFIRTGSSFLHPYFAFFLCIVSVAFFIQSLAAGKSIKSQIEKILNEALP